jgi:hypothetical protein
MVELNLAVHFVNCLDVLQSQRNVAFDAEHRLAQKMRWKVPDENGGD